jgi:hypothetical protein
MIEEEDPDDLSILRIDDNDETNELDIDIESIENDSNVYSSSSASTTPSLEHHGIMVVDSDIMKNRSQQGQKFDEIVADFQQQMLKLPRELRNLVAGGLAGMFAKSIVAPFDRIKILYQVSSAQFHILKVPQIAYRIVAEEGLTALWKGNVATLIRVFPYSGIQFMVFDRCKTFILKEQEMQYLAEKETSLRNHQLPPPKPKWGLSPVESLFAGMAAGAVSVVATYPLDLTRAQLAVLRTKKNQHNQGFIATLVDNYRNRGPVGLFRGITPTLIGILPYSGLAFAFNEQAKRKARIPGKKKNATAMKCCVVDFSPGVSSDFLTGHHVTFYLFSYFHVLDPNNDPTGLDDD